MVESLIIAFMTIFVYCIANAFSIKIGTLVVNEGRDPLYDVLHQTLPDWSKVVFIRDVVLAFLFVPLVFIRPNWFQIYQMLEQFQIVILIKAICIFFTYLPSSNKECKKTLDFHNLNHCHHNSTSGHAALCTLLGLLYIRCGVPVEIVFVCILLYCLLILLTRAHYTTDVWQGVIASLLVAL